MPNKLITSRTVAIISSLLFMFTPTAHGDEVRAPLPATMPAEQHVDPAREIAYSVQSLGCPLVEGIGCGHMLAPLLSRIDKLEGVARSSANWTGTMIRVTAKTADVRAAVAGRVREFFRSNDLPASELAAQDAIKAIAAEQWRGKDQIVDLTSYEYHTHALRLAKAFAEAQALAEEKSTALARIIDEQWERIGKESGPPATEDDQYARYWHARMAKFHQAVIDKAEAALTPQQWEALKEEAAKHQK